MINEENTKHSIEDNLNLIPIANFTYYDFVRLYESTDMTNYELEKCILSPRHMLKTIKKYILQEPILNQKEL